MGSSLSPIAQHGYPSLVVGAATIPVFSDAIDALQKLGTLVRSASGVPKRQRQKYIDAVAESFTLLETALVMVQTKLGDLLHIQDDYELDAAQKRRRFVQDLANLDNNEQWLRLERELSLCRSLRLINRELGSALNQLYARLTIEDQAQVNRVMDDVLERERFLADYISRSFRELADMATDAASSAEGRKAAWRAVKAKHDLLGKERRDLIDAERKFLEAI